MSNFADITEAQVKTVYEQTPEVNHYHTWEDVKKCEPLYLALKNKLIAHQQEHNMEKQNPSSLFLAIDNGSQAPQTALATAPRIPRSRAQDEKNQQRRSAITLHEKQINQLRSALRLARNCLQCDMGEDIKREALDELARSQNTIGELCKPR